jgi:hypothetical protein
MTSSMNLPEHAIQNLPTARLFKVGHFGNGQGFEKKFLTIIFVLKCMRVLT